MSLCLVVGRFPELSQSFVMRLIKDLIYKQEQRVFVYASSTYDRQALQRYDPLLYQCVLEGRLEIIQGGRSLMGYIAPLIMGCMHWKLLRATGLSYKKIIKCLCFVYDIKRCGIDFKIFHAQFLNIGVVVAFAKAAGIISAPVLSSIRGFDITNIRAVNDAEIKFLNTYCDCFLPVSKSLKDVAVDRGLSYKKLRVIYSGLDVASIPFRTFERKKYKPILFLQVGRLVEKKGADLSIHLIRHLKDNGISSRLDIVGTGGLEGPLRKLVEDLKLQDEVFFCGTMPNFEVLDKIAKSDYLLVPSVTAKSGDQEGIPNVIKEAMAIGCIVISSDHAGAPELIEHEKTGFLFKEGCIKDYQRVVQMAIARDCEAMAASARNEVIGRFDSAIVFKDLMEVYDSVSNDDAIVKKLGVI